VINVKDDARKMFKHKIYIGFY